MEDLDLSEFQDVFFDEAAENLASMESLLLEIDLDSADGEQLNAIFRAAHSIKGGSAAFGFKDITEVTHEMETVFDRVRKGSMPLSAELVDVFLASCDMLKSMFATRKGADEHVSEDAMAALCARLRAFLEPANTVVAPTAQVAIAAAPAAQAAPAAASHTYELVFGPFDKHFKAAEVDEVVQCLARIGQVDETTAVEKTASGKPSRRKTPLERRLRLVTTATRARLDEAIAFVTLPERVTIDAIDASSPVADAAPVEPEAKPAEADAATDPEGSFDKPVIDEKDFCLFVEPTRVADEPQEVAPTRPADNTVVELKPAAAKPAPAAASSDASSIRVSVQKVDALINLVGELVITEAMLAQAATQFDTGMFGALFKGLAQLQRNTRDLQESAMSIRMMPMSFVFGRFPRVVRDLATLLEKQVELKTEGESTELDKGLIERIVDPLTHLVRNSLDHGIESPAVRVARGKPAKGTITLRAFHRGGNIMVEVIDDGAGLDRERLLKKARERGMSVSDSMTDQEVFALIFDAGFSTAEKVTDVSGRGVGMDVVRRNIREMGGNVEISSTLGVGTRISIRLPLTLAILDGMSVAVGKEVFIIPLTYIVESLQPAEADVRTIAGKGRVVQVRGEYLPLVSLHQMLNIEPAVRDVHQGIVVILEAEGDKTAIFVDALVGQHQVVIKSLESNYRRVQGISGATIMGDGRVALILDVTELMNLNNKPFARAA